MADERVARWLFPDGPPTLAQVRSILVRDADHWKRHGWGPWIVRDAATRAMVGRIGIESCTIGGRDEVEVAWMVAADRWGEGLATEMAREAVRAAFEVVGLEDVVAYTLSDNEASQRVMLRLGMTYERDIDHVGLPHVLYRLSRPRAG